MGLAMGRLSDTEINERLKRLSGWRLVGNSLEKRFKLKDFMSAVALINKIAPVAEETEHHPDITLRNYNELTINLTTHDEGGITERDFDLAARIDRLAA